MKTLLGLIAITALVLSGCESMRAPVRVVDGSSKTVCEGKPKEVSIHYTDSWINVTPQTVRVDRKKGDAAIEFVLKPKKSEEEKSFDGRNVAVVGADFDASWIYGFGNKAKTGKASIFVCLPDDVPGGDAGTDYKYQVIVEGVGMIDPRVKVIH